MIGIYFVIFGALLNLGGSLIYARSTIRGETRPNRVTFLMWSIAPAIGVGAAYTSGVTWALLPVFMSAFGPFLILLASFVNPKAYWELHALDYGCGALSVLALVLWIITKEPVFAIVFAIASDALAALPTMIKAWKYPETESVYGYAPAAVASLTSFAALTRWSFAGYAFPAYLFVANTFLSYAVVRKSLFKLK